VFRRLLEGWNPWLSCVIVRRPALTAAGAFDESLPAFEDYDLFLRLAANGARFVGVSRPLLIRHEHHGRSAISGDPLRLRRGLEGLDRKWREAILGRMVERHTGAGGLACMPASSSWRSGTRSGAASGGAPGVGWRRWGDTFRGRSISRAAAVLVLLGPTGYDRLARLRDAELRYGRDESAR
jgi:hypothetical protein